MWDRFESSVISYGSQTNEKSDDKDYTFESSVISYGSQTGGFWCWLLSLFESSVISYGSQTCLALWILAIVVWE